MLLPPVNPSHPDPELAALLDSLVVRELTASEAARLAERLAREPATRAAYCETMAFEAMMHRELPRVEAVAAEPVAQWKAAGTGGFRGWWALAAALLVTAAVASFIIQSPGPKTRDLAPGDDLDFPVAAYSDDDNTVATVTNAAGVRIAGGSQRVESGARLRDGLIEIAGGNVEVTFDCGAVVFVEGPARLHLESEFRARLDFGRVRAEVPPQAIGFLLTTPGGVIRDLGTSFGVSVGATGATEVHVLEGKVEASLASAAAGTAPSLIAENEAVLLSPARIERTKFDAAQFSTDLPPAARETPLELAHWSFDPPGRTVMTSSAQPFTLTLRKNGQTQDDAATRFTPGVFGSGVTFDGETEAAWSNCPGIAGHAPRTVSAWVNIPADTRTDQPSGIVAWGRFRDGEKWQLSTNAAKGEGKIGALRQEFGEGYITGSTDLRDGRWHHVAVVFHGGHNADVTTHVKLYVDGRLETLTARKQRRIATGTLAQGRRSQATTFPVIMGRYLGQWRDRPIFYWRGALDEVRIHSAALTPSEIVALMEKNQLPP